MPSTWTARVAGPTGRPGRVEEMQTWAPRVSSRDSRGEGHVMGLLQTEKIEQHCQFPSKE